jgi:hypothetical protein
VENAALPAALQALWHLPYPLLVMDGEMQVLDHNAAAEELLSQPVRLQVVRRCGEVLRCEHALRSGACCGQTSHCPDCAVRTATLAAIESQGSVQTRAHIQRGEEARFAHTLVTAVGFVRDGEKLALLMLQDLAELVTSTGLLPLCAVCHKVRDESGQWHELPLYLHSQFDLAVTHSLCPNCHPRRGT